MKLHLEARRGPEAERISAEEHEIVTSHKAVGVYYGGDYAKELSIELHEQLSELLKTFAASLRR